MVRSSGASSSKQPARTASAVSTHVQSSLLRFTAVLRNREEGDARQNLGDPRMTRQTDRASHACLGTGTPGRDLILALTNPLELPTVQTCANLRILKRRTGVQLL